MERVQNYFRFDANESPTEVRNTLLVLAVLVATATYQAGLNPPGGVWQEDSADYAAGTSVMGVKNQMAYILFVVSNSFGLFSSIIMIDVLTLGFPLNLELGIAMFALGFSYGVSLASQAPTGRIRKAMLALLLIIPFSAYLISKYCRRYRTQRYANEVPLPPLPPTSSSSPHPQSRPPV